MQPFAALLDRLVLTPSRNAKLDLLQDYFSTAPDPARGWGLAALTGELEIRSVKAGAVKALLEDLVDPVLFKLSRDYVGDLAETVALLWPTQRRANRTPPLDEVVEGLLDATRAEGPALVAGWLDALDATGRWALLKLITGELRVGVSARLAKVALAQMGGVEPAEIEEIWHGLAPPYEGLFAWLEGRGPKPAPVIAAPFRPVMLAHPLIPKAKRGQEGEADSDAEAVANGDYAAEWKWDGIRVQAVSEGGARKLYTRTGDDISAGFPDVVEGMGFDAALDGELLVRGENGKAAPFNELQQRLNRKTVSPKQIARRPAFVRVYDVLVREGEDLRGRPFQERRAALEAFVAALPAGAPFDLSPLLPVESLGQLDEARCNPPAPEIEGLMLKRWDSVYEAGRPKGPWFKWKRDPFLVDAVLMYAQRGHGRRSSFYSDFTFGVWREVDGADQLTPVGKAYFGFTDEELKQLDRHVRKHTVERFGPVRSVKAGKQEGLVFEVAFEGLQRSARHKSGLAMRFPRINRIRWDKPPGEADRLQTLEAMLEGEGEGAPSPA